MTTQIHILSAQPRVLARSDSRLPKDHVTAYTPKRILFMSRFTFHLNLILGPSLGEPQSVDRLENDLSTARMYEHYSGFWAAAPHMEVYIAMCTTAKSHE